MQVWPTKDVRSLIAQHSGWADGLERAGSGVEPDSHNAPVESEANR